LPLPLLRLLDEAEITAVLQTTLQIGTLVAIARAFYKHRRVAVLPEVAEEPLAWNLDNLPLPLAISLPK
jgi:hypothetical protein